MATLLESPAVAVPSFTVFDELPERCFAFHPADRHAEPIVRAGEGAVIDTQDREMEIGAYYLRKVASGPLDYAIVQLVDSPLRASRGQHVYLARPSRPRTPDDWAEWMAAGRILPMADGPFELDSGTPSGGLLASLIVGKVIGLCSPDMRLRDRVVPYRGSSRPRLTGGADAHFRFKVVRLD